MPRRGKNLKQKRDLATSRSGLQTDTHGSTIESDVSQTGVIPGVGNIHGIYTEVKGFQSKTLGGLKKSLSQTYTMADFGSAGAQWSDYAPSTQKKPPVLLYTLTVIFIVVLVVILMVIL